MNKKEFEGVVWGHYYKHGRHDLPWRKTNDVYLILVSEMMLQQTQVDRVIPKYQAFIKKFPTLKRLAKASVGEVLEVWLGLGYNRRAKYLWQTARCVNNELLGKWPGDELSLRKLPGIGPYTASAIMAFTKNEPVALIETNVRQVFIHHFFSSSKQVTDEEILELVKQTLPLNRTREWYWALMDYGAYLKQIHGNVTQKSNRYTKQSNFHGSNRQIRGALIRVLTTAQSLTYKEILGRLSGIDAWRVAKQLAQLKKEEMIVDEKGVYRLS